MTIHIYFFMVKVQSCIYNSEWYLNILMLNLASNFQDSIVYLNNISNFKTTFMVVENTL